MALRGCSIGSSLESVMVGIYFMISGREADRGLWWSNADGWVDFYSATRFTVRERAELRLPLNGQWRCSDSCIEEDVGV